MLNLIHMNCYRMTRTRSLYIILFCLAFFCLLSCYMERVDYSVVQSEGKTTSQTSDSEQEGLVAGISITDNTNEEPVEGAFGISVQTPEKTEDKTPSFLEFYLANLASGILLLFLVIGTTLYVHGESKSGFIKNIAGQTRHKSYIYLSKIAAIAIYTAVSMLFYAIIQYVGLKAFLPYAIPFGKEYLSSCWKLLIAIYLLYIALLSATAMLVTLFRSATAGMVLGILACFGLFLSFAPYAEKLLHVKIQKYMIVANLQQMLIGASGKMIQSGILVGGICLIAYLLLGTVFFTKKDVV